MILRPAGSSSLRKLLEMKILHPPPDLLNQQVWEWTGDLFYNAPPLVDSDAHSSLKTSLVFCFIERLQRDP